ncbi:hypothetical protein [Hymenobacter lucidus]|uniref:Uncharacterized protein n=1 Tax=Hymenobacter lucidus TaxID=2880930 RepID=A0ABS8AN44_9BACT|nr:hypothetical protein [Hymenobacter lucidus]MCB2406726.1 hypothetical protein [Hymenobacter lucidus]
MYKIILPGLLLSFILGYLYLDVTVRDSYSGQWNCASTADARQQGLLLREYVVEPATLRFENYEASFTDCWVEERTRTSHRFIFFEQITKLGEPRFVLNYQGRRLTPDADSTAEAMLVPGNEGHGLDLAASRWDKQPLALAYHQYTGEPAAPSEHNDTLYFSIVRRWKDQRTYQIKAYPKPE